MKRVFFSLVACSLVVLGCDSADPEPGPPLSFRATLSGLAVIREADFSMQNFFIWPLPHSEPSVTSIQLVDDEPAGERLEFIGLSRVGPDGPSPGAFGAGSFLTCLQSGPSGCLFAGPGELESPLSWRGLVAGRRRLMRPRPLRRPSSASHR